jgi:hypothetical protein
MENCNAGRTQLTKNQQHLGHGQPTTREEANQEQMGVKS